MPVGIGHVREQRVDVGIAEPCALLAAGAVDESVGRAELEGARADAPDFVEGGVVAFEVCFVAAWVAALDCAGGFELGATARDKGQVAETNRLERFETFGRTAVQRYSASQIGAAASPRCHRNAGLRRSRRRPSILRDRERRPKGSQA